MILILSSREDIHARRVMAELNELGLAPWLQDLSEFPLAAALSLHYGGERSGARWFRDARRQRWDLTRVRAVWWRRPQPFQLDPALTDPQHRLFAANECREVLSGLWQTLDAFWINDPVRDDTGHRKTYQLALAEELGMAVPPTVITNDPAEATAFVASADRVVVKPFTGTPGAWRETRLVKEQELAQMDLVRMAPVILQEYVDGVDVRVTVVGEDVFPATVDVSTGSYPVDFRMNMDVADIRPSTLPEATERAIRDLMARLGLVYGALDFRRRPDGEHVFLEINPAGQWLFVEERTGQPIARTLARLLARHATGDSRQR